MICTVKVIYRPPDRPERVIQTYRVGSEEGGSIEWRLAYLKGRVIGYRHEHVFIRAEFETE